MPHPERVFLKWRGQMPSIVRTQRGDAIGAAVGIEWIFGRGDGVGVVDVAEGGEVLGEDALVDGGVGEVEAAFAVGYPDTEGGVGHSLKKHRWTIQNRHT